MPLDMLNNRRPLNDYPVNTRRSRSGTLGTGIDYSDVSKPVQLQPAPKVEPIVFNIPKINFPKTTTEKEKKLTAAEKKEQAENERNRIAIEAANQAENLFKSSQAFNDASLARKQELIDSYLEKSLPDFMQANSLYKSDPQLSALVSREVAARLRKITQTEADEIKKAEEEKGVIVGDMAEYARQAVTNVGNVIDKVLPSDRRISDYESVRDELNGMEELQSRYEKDLEYMRNPPAHKRNAYTDADIAKQEAKIANQKQAILQKQSDLAKLQPAYVDAMRVRKEERDIQEQDQQDRYTARLNSNAYFRELERSKAEAQQQNIAEGGDAGFGIMNNPHGMTEAFRAVAQQVPNAAAIATAAGLTAGGVALTGGTASPAAIAAASGIASGLIGASQAGDEAYDTVMAMSREEVEKLPAFKQVFEEFKASGLSDDDAAAMAQYKLATSTESNAMLKAAPVAGAIGMLNPASSIVRGAAVPSMMRGLSKNMLARGAGEIATGYADEYADEYMNKVVVNDAMNSVLGTDIPVTEGAHEAGKMGGTLGAAIGGGAVTTRGTANLLREKFTKTTPAQQQQQATVQPSGQQTANAQPTNAIGATATAQPQATNATGTTATAQQPSGPDQVAAGAQQAMANYSNTSSANPQRALNIRSSQAIKALTDVGDEILNNGKITDATSMSEDQIVRVANAIDELKALGSEKEAQTWANNLRVESKDAINIKLDDVLKRYTEITNTVAQAAQDFNSAATVTETETPSAAGATPQPARSANAPSLNELNMQLGDAINASRTAYTQSSPNRLFGKELTNIGTILEQIERNYGKDEAVFSLARYADPELARASQHGSPIFEGNTATREETYDNLMNNYRERGQRLAGVPKGEGRGLNSYLEELNDAWNTYREGRTISMDESDLAIEDIGSILDEIETKFGRQAAVDALDRFANGKDNVFGMNNYGTNVLYTKLMNEYRRGNGTNTGTVQGPTATNSQAAATQSGTGTTTGQQNSARNRRNRRSAQSTGFSWAPRQNTRQVAEAIPLNQPTSEQTEPGADSRRDNSVNDTAGAQSDTGSGSIAGTTEQRAGNEGRSEGVSPTQPQNTLIQDVPQAGTREFNQSVLRGARQSITDINVSPESEAKEAQVYERVISSNLNQQARNLGPRIESNFEQNKQALIDMGQDEAMAELNAALITRVQIGMEQLTGEYFDITVHPYDMNDYSIEHGPEQSPIPGTTIPGFTQGGKIYIADPEHLETMPHEVMHAMLNKLAALSGLIRLRANKGDTTAQQFIREFEDFCVSVGMARRRADGSIIDNHGNPLDVMTEEFLSNPGIQERAAIAMETYWKEGKFPDKSGMNELYRPMAQRITEWFRGFANALRAHVATFVKNFTRPWVTGEETEPDNHYTRRAIIVKQYAKPRLFAYNHGLPPAAKDFFDSMFEGYPSDPVNFAYGTNATAYTQAVIDATTASVTNEYIALGIAPRDAVILAQDRMREAVRYAFATEAERGQLRTQSRLFRMNHELARQPELASAVGTEHLTNPATTLLLANDKDILDAAAGGSISGNTTLYVNNSIDSATAVDDFQSPNMETILDEAEELALQTQYRTQLDQIIEEGSADSELNIADSAWFESYFSQGGLLNEDGTPKIFYVNGNTISEKARGYELETQSYARSVRPLRNFSEINARNDLSADRKKFLNKAYGKAAQDFLHGNDVQLDWNERRSFINAGYDSLLFTDENGNKSYVILNATNIVNNYRWDGEMEVMLDDMSISNEDIYYNVSVNPIKPNSTVEQLLNVNGELLARIQDGNAQAVVAQRAEEGVENSGMFHTQLLPSQEVSTWGRLAHFGRKMIVDDRTAIRKWAENVVSVAVGYAHTSPLIVAIDNMFNKVRGTRISLNKKILMPISDWLENVVKTMGDDINIEVLGKELASIYRDLHIIESAAVQEQRLIQAITDASLIAEPSRRAKAVDFAQKRYNAYRARQGGSMGADSIDPATGHPFALEGGMTINECMTELNELTAKYPPELVQEAMNRIRQGWNDLINNDITKGVYSETDVRGFRESQYYMKLTTLEDYQQSDPTDIHMFTSAKLDYVRNGSQAKSVDALSALQMHCSKSANAIGAADVSNEMVATYRVLEQRAAQGDSNTKVAEVFIGSGSNGVKLRYINGMAIVKTSVLENIADSISDVREAQRFLANHVDNAAFRARALEVNPETGMTEIVPYSVFFNTEDLKTTNNGVMKSNKDVHEALRTTFIDDKKSNKFVRGLGWTTAALASTNTTYMPAFAPTNMFRDIPERLSNAVRATYRDAQGNAVNGAKVATQAVLNLSYAGEVMRAVFTGKPENIEGKVGQYLVEFEEQGILNTASVKAMLQNVGNTNFAFIEEKIKALEENPDSAIKQFAQNMNEARKRGRAVVHLYNEMFYAVAPFALYKALRDNGLSPDDAAFAVTDMMNLSKRGSVTRFLSPVLPFLSSIGQTAGQMANNYGLSTTTFGHQRSFDKEYRAGMLRMSALMAAVYVGGGALIAATATMMGTPDDPDKGKRYFGNMDLVSFTSTPLPIFSDMFVKVQHGFSSVAHAMLAALAYYQYDNGFKKGSDVIAELADAMYRSVSPVAGPQVYGKDVDFLDRMALTFSPQIITPLVESAIDMDYFGRRVNHDENIQPGQRKSDSGSVFVSREWKDFAKTMYDTFGIDWTPDKWKHIITGYAISPLKPYLDSAMEDPLIVKDNYQSVRDRLGPHWTAVGGGYMVGAITENSYSRYKDALELYNNLVKDAGIYDLIKGKGGWDNTKYSKIVESMYAAGFQPEVAYDYAELQSLDSKLDTRTTQLRKDLDQAELLNLPASTIQELYRAYRYDVENMINDTLNKVALTNGTLDANKIELPSADTIRAYRAVVADRATLTGAQQ